MQKLMIIAFMVCEANKVTVISAYWMTVHISIFAVCCAYICCIVVLIL